MVACGWVAQIDCITPYAQGRHVRGSPDEGVAHKKCTLVVDGGLGATLSVRPSLIIVVDGEPVIEGPVLDPCLYTITPGPWGSVETEMVPVLPILLDRIAHRASVDVVLGDGMRFRLDRTQSSGFSDFLREIPADMDFGVHVRAKALPGFITQ